MASLSHKFDNNAAATTWSISSVYTVFGELLEPGEVANDREIVCLRGRVNSKKILGKNLFFLQICNFDDPTKSIQLEFPPIHFKESMERLNILRSIIGKNDEVECLGFPAKSPNIGKMSFVVHSIQILKIHQNLRGVERVLQGLQVFGNKILPEASVWLHCKEKDLALLSKLQVEAEPSCFRKALRFVTNNLGMGCGPEQRSLADIGNFILQMEKKKLNDVALSRAVSTAREQRIREIVARRQAGLVVVLEDISNKFNAATILRSCDAYGVARVIFVFNKGKEPDWFSSQYTPENDNSKLNPINTNEGSNFLFNGNVCDWRNWGSWGLNSSVSAVKWVQCLSFLSTEECLSGLQKQNFISISTQPPKSSTVSIYDSQFTATTKDNRQIKKLAIWFGSEHSGLSAAAINGCDMQVHVPMMGMVESLNLSVSVATVLFEVTRQRRQRSKKLGICHGDDATIKGYTLPIAEQEHLVGDLCSSTFV